MSFQKHRTPFLVFFLSRFKLIGDRLQIHVSSGFKKKYHRNHRWWDRSSSSVFFCVDGACNSTYHMIPCCIVFRRRLLPSLLRIWILLYSRFKLLSACFQIGKHWNASFSILVYCIVWVSVQKLVSRPIEETRNSFYEFWKQETPKSVFCRTDKEWPYE